MIAYQLYKGSSPAVTAKATALLSKDYGYTESATLDGKSLLFVVEEHQWYGAQPDKPPSPHKGVTVYERTESDSNNPLISLGLISLGYWLLRKR